MERGPAGRPGPVRGVLPHRHAGQRPRSGRGTPRWPRFAAAVADRGAYRSVHALPLRLRGEPIGALNLFHRQPGPLPADDLALGQALADMATIGILSERAINRGEVLNEQLQTALNSRVIIEQAKGVLAERGSLGMDAAFDRLRGYSRDHNLGSATSPGRSSSPTSPPRCWPVAPSRTPPRDGPKPHPFSHRQPDDGTDGRGQAGPRCREHSVGFHNSAHAADLR